MGITAQQFAERAARLARKGRTETEARIFVDRVALLIPNAAHQFSTEVANDPHRRGRMRATWDAVSLTDGTVEVLPATVPNLLTVGLPWGMFFEGDDTERSQPLVWKRDASSLFRKLSPNFGYVALLDNLLITRKRSSGSLTEMTSLTIISNYVFDFSGNYPLPDEFEEDAIMTLAEFAATDVATTA